MGTIAQKLEYLNDTRLLLKDNINKINNVLDDNSTFRSYPQELFNGYLDILNNGTDTLWNNLEKVSASGEEVTLENVETAPMKMVLNGNTSQDGEPSPDYPQQVKVVKGENVVSVSGKNLFDTNYYLETQYGTAGGVLTNTAYFKDGENITTNVSLASGRKFLNHKKLSAGTYTMSFNKSFSGTGHHIRYSVRDFVNLTDIVTTKSIDNTNISASFSFTLTEETDVFISIQPYSTDEGTLTLSNIQLEEGSATPYVPYSKTDYPLSLGTLELCKIGDYKDYLFKRNGKWYVHKAIGKKVVTSSETLAQTDSYSKVRYFKFDKNTNDIDYNKYNNADIFYTSAKNFKNVYDYNNENMIGKISPQAENIRYWVGFPKETTLAQAKEKLVGSVLYYILKTPTEEEITNTTLIEQLEAISKAKSVKDKTYITQTNDELPFILDVEAIKEYEVV